jgi:hypothetical protein
MIINDIINWLESNVATLFVSGGYLHMFILQLWKNKKLNISVFDKENLAKDKKILVEKIEESRELEKEIRQDASLSVAGQTILIAMMSLLISQSKLDDFTKNKVRDLYNDYNALLGKPISKVVNLTEKTKETYTSLQETINLIKETPEKLTQPITSAIELLKNTKSEDDGNE